MESLDVYTLGPWVVLYVCRVRANPEMGMGGGVSAATVAVRLETWGLMEGLRLRAVVEWASISCTIESPGDLR